jgi:hypothetical protein
MIWDCGSNCETNLRWWLREAGKDCTCSCHNCPGLMFWWAPAQLRRQPLPHRWNTLLAKFDQRCSIASSQHCARQAEQLTLAFDTTARGIPTFPRPVTASTESSWRESPACSPKNSLPSEPSPGTTTSSPILRTHSHNLNPFPILSASPQTNSSNTKSSPNYHRSCTTRKHSLHSDLCLREKEKSAQQRKKTSTPAKITAQTDLAGQIPPLAVT